MTDNLHDSAILPKVVSQHCLRTRFNGSSCTRCRDACPRQLPVLDDVISINASVCSGCHLCAAACPSGAIEPQLTVEALTTALNRSLPVILSCHKTQDESHLQIPCFGFLSEEYLIALHTSVPSEINFNIIHCSECCNHSIVSSLRERLCSLEAKTGLPINTKIRLVDQTTDLHFQHEAIGRRSFFSSFARSLLREAATILAPPSTKSEKPVSYAQKHIPLRLTMLNRGLEKITGEEQQLINKLFRWELQRSDTCDGCYACTKICPTGALKENQYNKTVIFEFDTTSCTGCGLCVEFCLNKSLMLPHPCSGCRTAGIVE